VNFDESVKYLYSLGHETLAIKFGLENTRRLLAALGEPQKSFLKIQIAGTNGKGSVAAFLDSICRAASIKTGLFTSPHLVSITERIKIDGLDISEKKFALLTTEVRATAEKLISAKQLEALPTFFEHLTAIGLLAFARENVEIGILETGLGGRLDSVTAAEAEIAAITQIALDHQEYLGNTIKEIAAEKAAIIRPDVRAVVVSNQEREAMNAVRGKCRECKIALTDSAKITKIHRIPMLETYTISFQTETNNYPNIDLNLLGRHQADNAATAISLAEALREAGFKISNDNVRYGLETARHAGRLEFAGNILYDGAHNEAGAKVLADFLQEFIRNKITLVFAAMRDKDLSEIASILFPLAENLILTRAENPRSATPEKLREFVPQNFPTEKVFVTESVSEAIKKAQEITAPEDLICVTGSLYLVGEAKSITNYELRIKEI
jgi:dihydrofolate synthase/folylpolyglutamate synthase